MVHFVSAGPGDPDLITVKGRRYLEEADVVIYAGSLVNPELLNMTKKSCRIYNSAYMNLEDVLEVIEEAEKSDETTVRLHTGDTTLYSTIREQIEQLEERNIIWDVIPGVSAFQAASAAVGAELTLPGITQSVILTRCGGRTKVPDRESIARFAKHQSTMALYLSSSLADQVRKELMEGGYSGNTPVLIVYKASWPEERVYTATVESFPELMEREGITRTAVILIGEVFRYLNKNEKGAAIDKAEQSKLYDAAFTTGYRQARRKTVWMCACTEKAVEMMEHLKTGWQRKHPDVRIETIVKCRNHPYSDKRSLKELVKDAFDRVDMMVFFSSTGIAVRSVAPLLKSKVTDPAVIAVDELGTYCIPLVSGHLGGANEYAEEISEIIQSEAVITTASDLEHKFAVDLFAKKNGLRITDMKKALEISARIVSGEELSIYSDFEIAGEAPRGVRRTDAKESADIYIESFKNAKRSPNRDQKPYDGYENALVLRPIDLDIGIGCRKGIQREDLDRSLCKVLDQIGADKTFIHSIGSIDLKMEEEALLSIVLENDLKSRFFSAKELMQLPGQYTESEFVRDITGVDCVCERSAVALSGGNLIVPKTKFDGITIAVAENNRTLHF